MASSVLFRWISHKGAAESSLRWISRTVGIFSSARSPNCCRMMSTLRALDESVLNGPYSSTLPSRVPPWLMLPPAFEGGDMVYQFYSLAENKVLSLNKRGGGGGGEELELPDDDDDDDANKLVGSAHGWLALFNERNCDVFLSNPLSGRRIKLPPIHTLPIPEVNLRGGFGCVIKVITTDEEEEEEDCGAMMIFGPEERLAFCHSREWTPIGALFDEDEDEDGKFARVYEDLVYSSRHKLVFCITQFGDLECWDLRDPQSPRIDWINKEELEFDEEENYTWGAKSGLKELCRQLKYLVFDEQSNKLFLVTRHIMERMGPDGSYVKSIYYGKHRGWDDSYPYKTVGFDVHKIDRGGGKLRYMEEGSLDGLVMFIGINHSFAMSASDELKPNSIYFTDAKELSPPDWDSCSTFGGHDIGIFSYENRTFSPCYYPCDVQSIKRIEPPPVWFAPTPP